MDVYCLFLIFFPSPLIKTIRYLRFGGRGLLRLGGYDFEGT